MSSDVKFEEESVYASQANASRTANNNSNINGFVGPAPIIYSRFQRSNDIPTIVRVIMKSRIVRTEKQAQKLIILLILIIIATAIFLARDVIFPSEMKELPFNKI